MRKFSLLSALFLYLVATLGLYVVIGHLLIKISPDHALLIGSLFGIQWLTAKITNLHVKDINQKLQNYKENIK